MEENKNQNLAENVVGGIHKDFVIVGKHRVHGWYAWAIIGIVFGMALGIAYVANRNAQFTSSQAAGFKLMVSGPVGFSGNAYAVGVRNEGFIADAIKIPVSSGASVTIGSNLGLSFAGNNIANQYNFESGNVNAVVVSNDQTKVWMGTRSGQTIAIDTAKTPAIDSNKKATLTFKGVYVNPQGNKKTGAVSGTFFSGIDVGGRFAMNGASRSKDITEDGTLVVPRGMPLYTADAIKITLDNNNKKFGDKNLLLPGQQQSGTWTLYFRDRNRAGVSDGNVEIFKKEFTQGPPDVNHAPVFTPIPDQTIIDGQTLKLTIKATDPDGDPIIYSVGYLFSDETFNPATGEFTYTAKFGNSHSNEIFYAADDQGAKTSLNVNFKVVQIPLSLWSPNGNEKSQTYPAGSNGVTLVTLGVTNTTDRNIIIKSVEFYDKIKSGTPQDIINFTLYARPHTGNYPDTTPGTKFGGPIESSLPLGGDGSRKIIFPLTSELIVPAKDGIDILLRADILANGSSHEFGVTSNSSIAAVYQDGILPIPLIKGAPIGPNSVLTDEVKLTVTTTALGAQKNRKRTGTPITAASDPNKFAEGHDNLAEINFTTGPAGSVKVEKITLHVTGSAIGAGVQKFYVYFLGKNDFFGSSASQCPLWDVSTNSSLGYCILDFSSYRAITADTKTKVVIAVDSNNFVNNPNATDDFRIEMNYKDDLHTQVSAWKDIVNINYE